MWEFGIYRKLRFFRYELCMRHELSNPFKKSLPIVGFHGKTSGGVMASIIKEEIRGIGQELGKRKGIPTTNGTCTGSICFEYGDNHRYFHEIGRT